MLQPYLKCKQIELGKAATSCRSEHYLKIIRVYTAEMECSTKAVQLSGDIMQDTYYLLSANQLLTQEMEDKMLHLSKVHDGQRGVRFTNGVDGVHGRHDTDDDELMPAQNIDDITLETGLDLMNAEGDEAIFAIPLPPPPVNRAKRALITDEAGPSMPKRFIPSDSGVLDATQVLETHSDEEETLRTLRPVVVIGKPPVKQLNGLGKRPVPPGRVLKDSNMNVNKDCPVAKVMLKAVINGRPVTLKDKEKENKQKFLTTVKKSPRRNSIGATGKSKQISRST